MSLNRVIRGSFWLYVSVITSNFLCYTYWLLTSGFVPASTVGSAAISCISRMFIALVAVFFMAKRIRLLGQLGLLCCLQRHTRLSGHAYDGNEA